MSTTEQLQQEISIVCDLRAIPTNDRKEHIARAKRLLGFEFQERQELPDGYVWRFTADQYEDVCKYIAYDRLCCSFLTYCLEMTPQRGPIWLRITGNPEGKTALMDAISDLPNVDPSTLAASVA